jgi:hypothetical protein
MATITIHRNHALVASAILGAAALIVWLAPWSARARGFDTASATAPGSAMAVDCEPTQQALVRQVVVSGETHVRVQCVTSGLSPAALPSVASAPAPGWVMAPAPTVQAVPAVYAPPAPVRTAAASSAPVRRTVTRDTSRSWQKRALVIGGTAGAGAGIGALIGGKKGALIGAAIGGGGATVYELAKDR